ncbi:glycosyltransferase [bacterium]|nr:glycosyltransferase [bacterium]
METNPAPAPQSEAADLNSSPQPPRWADSSAAAPAAAAVQPRRFGPPARVALVHDWVTSFGGAERCLIQLHQLFPSAPIYTLVHDTRNTPPELEDAHIVTSHLQKLPGSTTDYQKFLTAMPYAIEQFDLRSFDLVLSSSHAVAKGVLTHHRQKHLSYCYTPMRYIWDLYHTYLSHTRMSSLQERAFRMSAHYLRQWDYSSAQRVDKFIAISETVKGRIKHLYGREAPVVYPPVDCGYFVPDPQGASDYYLVVSRAVPYKRLDLAIEVFNQRSERLLVVGTGPLLERFKRQAKRNIEFLGLVSDEDLKVLYQNCRALLFPAEEDFGLTPVEAMACGRPVVALGYGGASETVLDGVTGVHFAEQSAVALDAAIDRLEGLRICPLACRQRAESFDQRIFQAKIRAAAEYLLRS